MDRILPPSGSTPEIRFPTNNHLAKLHHWLSFKVKIGFLIVGYFFAPGLITMILVSAALVFAPFMLWKLAALKKWEWIAAFFLLVVGPALGGFMFSDGTSLLLSALLPLVMFYVFTWTLKIATAEWIENDQGRELLKYWDQQDHSHE